MSQWLLMLRKEWLNFISGSRGGFIMQLFLIVSWSMLLAYFNGGSVVAFLKLGAFAVLIAANFSSTVFVAERMSGSLEILLTSGLSRNAILWGKMLFVLAMTAAVGGICIICAFLLRLLAPQEIAAIDMLNFPAIAVYITAAFLNSASSAYFSVRLPDPRIQYFLNLLLIAAIFAAYATVSAVYSLPVSLIAVAGLLLILGMLFALLAVREFHSERIIRPVIY